MITGKESQPLEEALVREGIDMVLGVAESCRARRPEVEGSKIIRPASKLLGQIKRTRRTKSRGEALGARKPYADGRRLTAAKI